MGLHGDTKDVREGSAERTDDENQLDPVTG